MQLGVLLSVANPTKKNYYTLGSNSITNLAS
jgi:hypothetical protein